MSADRKWNRRTALRAGAVLAGAAVTAPLVGESVLAQGGLGADADALFLAGEFEEAGRAYEEILSRDPGNAHAARQRGYVGLLSNKFPDAEKYLTMALDLAPDDQDAHRKLADCYIRQDKLALSVPHWQAAGQDVQATWFAAVSGAPYQVHGDLARLPWQQLDPIPIVEASVNGGPPKKFAFYTGAPWLGMSKKVAEEAGLTAVAKQKIEYLNGYIWQYFGVLESFRLGDLELRNIPVEWSEPADENVTEDAHDGMIGMWVFYHLLTTFDYAGRSLILRRRTAETAGQVRADAERAGVRPLPVWLAREHMLHSRGSIAGSGERVIGANFGGTGEIVAGMSVDTAKQLGVRTDFDRPLEAFAHSHPVITYPCYPREVRIGDAVVKDSYCNATENRKPAPHGFEVIGHLSHCFWKPYHATVDFTDMRLYIGKGPAS